MADAVATAGIVKKRTFKKFSYKGVDLDALLDMSTDDLVKLFSSRIRRRFSRGLTRKPMALIKKLRKAKRDAPAGEKPEAVRTHLRNMIIVPEMIGSVIGVYNGKTFNQVEIKPEMIGHYLAEFSISYKPVKHGRPGVGATNSSRVGHSLMEEEITKIPQYKKLEVPEIPDEPELPLPEEPEIPEEPEVPEEPEEPEVPEEPEEPEVPEEPEEPTFEFPSWIPSFSFPGAGGGSPETEKTKSSSTAEEVNVKSTSVSKETSSGPNKNP
ncbi:unnamed protein product [Eruca vesicaria subsp. sativa]|uniref:40S ribosomal protein S15 n=1 Tax=Eruca vesicaria subsp. sativa TaxID=29727 RepID=A0ABC8M8Y1_ERUVS|nr:unnamed protein product [Eruca vesicaria subsp. sativa]